MGVDDASVIFDDLLETAGPNGIYQISVFIMLSFFSFWGVEGLMMPFIGGEMPHWCRVAELVSLSEEQQRYIMSPPAGDHTDKLSSCTMYKLNYSKYTRDELEAWNRSNMVSEATPVIACTNGWVYGSGGIFNSTVVNRFDLVCSRAWLVEMASSVLMLGILVGAVTSGTTSDRVGRKKTLLLFLVVKIIGLFLSTYTDGYIGFAIARFIIGIGSSGCYITAYVICMEIVGATQRSVNGVIFNMLFSVGLMALPILSFFIRNERTLQLVIAVPNIFYLLLWFAISESPRWLVVRGRYHEAISVLKHIAKINRRDFPDDITYDGSEEALSHEEGATLVDLFRTPVIRKTTLIVYIHWFVDSLLYYGLSLNASSLSGNMFINSFLMSVVEIPANMICLFFLNWKYAGRKLTCSASHLAAAASSFLTIPLILQGGGYSVTALAMFGKAFVTIGFTGIYVYSAEVFPTEVRNVGLGTASMCARISGMAAPFVGKPLQKLWQPLPATICGFCACLSGGLTLLLPETRGHPLLETVRDAERTKCDSRAIDGGTRARHGLPQFAPLIHNEPGDIIREPYVDEIADGTSNATPTDEVQNDEQTTMVTESEKIKDETSVVESQGTFEKVNIGKEDVTTIATTNRSTSE